VFAILALRHGLTHRSSGGTAPHLSWLTLHSAGGWSGLVAGLLISVFWYSGWETSVVVNEETRQARRNPGLAGIGSLIAVLIASLILGALFLSAVTPDTMSNNSAWITDLGFQLAGKPWGYLLIIAIMLGYLGGIETTIITFGNVAYSMGRDGVLAGRFASLSERTRMPTFAIVVFSIQSLLVFLVQVWASGGTLANIASDLASSLGLMFVIYYALTGLAAAWMLRGIARTNVTVAITGVLAPLAGAIALVAIGVKTWSEPSTTTPIKVTFLVAVVISIAVVIVSKLRGTTDFWSSRESRAMTEADLTDAPV
jgi:amino acid transporter